MPPANSTMLPLGTPAPKFQLPDYGMTSVGGQQMTLEAIAGSKATVVAFICNHCPFVKHLADPLAALAKDLQGPGVGFVAISSNDIETHPADAPDKMTAEAKARGYVFPYLFDETQEVAKAYSAACTPDFFVFDADHKLAYRGQFDDTRPDNGTATGADLRAAIEAIVAGSPVPEPQNPSIGCGIKWKPGNQPDYA
ncbi:MAG: thioredoxin family protein [Planctomycetota bacterium]